MGQNDDQLADKRLVAPHAGRSGRELQSGINQAALWGGLIQPQSRCPIGRDAGDRHYP
jgi:hypothetical protein